MPAKTPTESKDETKPKFDLRTIKLSLNSILHPNLAEEDKATIVREVYDRCSLVSQIMVLASLYLVYAVNNAFDSNLKPFFTQTVGKQFISSIFIKVTSEFNHELPPEFKAMVNLENWPKRRGITQIIEYAKTTYLSNVTTNLTTWLEVRLTYFLRMRTFQLNAMGWSFDQIDIRNAKKQLLFNEDWTEDDFDRIAKRNKLYFEVRNRLLPSFDNYLTIIDYVEERWFESLWFFIWIQREIEQFLAQTHDETHAWLQYNKTPRTSPKPNRPMPPKVKNFAAIPICDFQLKHIKLDTRELIQLVAKLRKHKGGLSTEERKYYSSHKDELWSIFFNMEEINRISQPNQKFHHMIVTNSVCASVLYDTPKRTAVDVETKKAMIQRKLGQNQYKYIVAIDPGMKTYMAGVRHNVETTVQVNKLRNFTFA